MLSTFLLAVDVLYPFNNAIGMSTVDGEFLPPKFIEKGIPYFGKIYHILQVSALLHGRKLIVNIHTAKPNQPLLGTSDERQISTFTFLEIVSIKEMKRYLIKCDQNVDLPDI